MHFYCSIIKSYYALARNNRELQLIPHFTGIFYYTRWRKNRKLQIEQ